jgi:uncharacterized surface protein with fasciclin (FAS1) repeats
MLNGKDSRTKCRRNANHNASGGGSSGAAAKFQAGAGNSQQDLEPQIVIPNLEACNGMVHIVVDDVLLPKRSGHGWMDVFLYFYIYLFIYLRV